MSASLLSRLHVGRRVDAADFAHDVARMGRYSRLGIFSTGKGGTMNRIITIAIVAACIGLVPVAARAQERLGHAALRALSGALAAGPVGLCAARAGGFNAARVHRRMS